jgi:ABC-type multidrug transport system fused ATPase/permease subunit
LRFYDVNSGRILLDGHDIRQLSLRHLRGAVSIVSQDAHLFQGTIRENVVYGQEHASEEKVLEALRDAEALSLIETLPGGLDAEVGERGNRLSGGKGSAWPSRARFLSSSAARPYSLLMKQRRN